MKITPETKTLATIFQTSSENIYTIPVYQRNYSWKEEQIETLFNDIKFEETGYYVGNLLINSEDGNNNVIDGQQRLTTLSLFLLAAYEKFVDFRKEEDLSESLKEDIYEATTDIKRQVIFSRTGNVRLTLLDKDQEIWTDLAKSVLNKKEPGRWGKYAFSKRYGFIKDKLFSDFTDVSELLGYYHKLNNVELLQISVPDLSDAYQVFASLNSKGLPLTPLDLLKNIFLSKNGDINKWNELRDLFSIDDELDDRKMTQFILNNYDAFHNMKTASSITKGRLVKEYTEIFKEKNYIDTLIENANVFKEIANSDFKQFDYSLSGLAQLDSTTAYPFLMYVLKNKESLEIEEYWNRIISSLINFYVRRNVALVPKASNVRQRLFELKNRIFEESLIGKDLFAAVQGALREMTPSNSQMQIALEDGLYDKNTKTARFILINLERSFPNKIFTKGTPDSLDQFDKNSNKLIWQIEHILPQKLTDDWKKMISSEDMSQAENIQNEVVHLLGNLTLTPYNPGLGNRSFIEKVKYEDNGNKVGLELGLHLNESIDTAKGIWNKESIIVRNKVLTEEFLRIFSLPEK
ncbi:DUF262 domain-containing protein [Lactococcus petauri]|uniref:DUF262 domain-containing HNH endonuclease family protein n=4 Tax=Lactococcus petauri TaxID=1940789 RepID=A0ABZ2SDY4_9LACT|nr:DUF262 domain-containing protein [Lactococcus petauri]OAL08775.1 hypothetical protein A7X72_01086 [Lactococcus garvieae]MCV5952785.1 DUF262 domain-containing HNH endonuclease family protein [Lactococcus petauri]MCV5967193.1 DUF262 domain-containing HNH endonuclease family protein [Lactococcus petauri]MCV5969562.1 DUF262 domain-containing HNH endonuclease family protein [Lactococcus petauri]MCV5980640.1 DUF262 domain-containing HNH endonuclease family protein [Lactococcus petauri]